MLLEFEREQLWSMFLNKLQDFGVYVEFVTECTPDRQKQLRARESPQQWVNFGIGWFNREDPSDYWRKIHDTWWKEADEYISLRNDLVKDTDTDTPKFCD